MANRQKKRLPPPPVLSRNIALFAGFFRPWTRAHETILQSVCQYGNLDRIVVWPLGLYEGRTDARIPTDHQISLIKLGVSVADMRVELILDDLRLLHGMRHTPNIDIQSRLNYEPRTELGAPLMISNVQINEVRVVWHVVGADNVPLIRGAWKNGEELWHNGRFLIAPRSGYEDIELPPHHQVLDVDTADMWSARDVVAAIRYGRPGWEAHVAPVVARRIKEDALFGGEIR